RAPNHIPRPRNAFIIFRSHLNDCNPPENTKTADGSKINQSDVSKDAGKVWQSMSAEEKQPFFEKAYREKREHSLRHPNYSYAP
ncbi:HMG-box, partial [Coprinopsis marcescibilis]